MPPVELGLLTLPRGQGDGVDEPNPSHTLMLRDAQEAERLGFGTVWIPDHFYMERPNGLVTFPDCWTRETATASPTATGRDPVRTRAPRMEWPMPGSDGGSGSARRYCWGSCRCSPQAGSGGGSRPPVRKTCR